LKFTYILQIVFFFKALKEIVTGTDIEIREFGFKKIFGVRTCISPVVDQGTQGFICLYQDGYQCVEIANET
jgi:hypothetical protein